MLVLLWACSNEQDNRKIANSLSIDNDRTQIMLDTNRIQTFHKNGNVKEVGLLIDKKKIGLWKSYDESGNLVSAFHYFNDSLVFELTKAELDFKNINIAKQNISFSIPKDFKEINVSGMSESIVFAAKKNCNQSSTVFCPNLVITAEDNILYNLKDSITQLADKVSMKFEKFKLINIEKGASIEDSFKITFIGRINNKKLGGVVFAFIKKQKLYNFSYIASNEEKDEFLKQKDIFDEIITSIKLL